MLSQLISSMEAFCYEAVMGCLPEVMEAWENDGEKGYDVGMEE